jgi:Fic family protein
MVVMFEPHFKITLPIVNSLVEIEAARQSITDLNVTGEIRTRFMKTARMFAAHYSTKLEGNPLTWDQAVEIMTQKASSPRSKVGGGGYNELLGYYHALKELRVLKDKGYRISEAQIHLLHALITRDEASSVKGAYRLDQNLIQDSSTAKVFYLPPEPQAVPVLMRDLMKWIDISKKEIPCPLRAGIAQHQLMTIHPYSSGNGRTARLLSSLILWLGGYDLNGFCSLEEHYARDPETYYKLIALELPQNYMERAENDMTSWLEYFCAGMAASFKNIATIVRDEMHTQDFDQTMSGWLDWRQRKVLALFKRCKEIKTSQVGELLNLDERTARTLCQKWVQSDFLRITTTANKNRRYALHEGHSSRRTTKRVATKVGGGAR